MTEERDNGKVFFKINNIEKAQELRKLFKDCIEEDDIEYYRKKAGRIIEEILEDEKDIFFTKEQIHFLTGMILFFLADKRHLLEEMGETDADIIDLTIGGYFLADTQSLLSILKRKAE